MTQPVIRLERIVSGGQTGTDRAALDWALGARIPHGGWCPCGRRAEDGPLPERYELTETAGGVKCNINPLHIEEEMDNLIKYIKEDLENEYRQVKCDVLILRAKDGIYSQNQLQLPDAAMEIMLKSIPRVSRLDLEGNHFGVVFWENQVREQAVLSFIGD